MFVVLQKQIAHLVELTLPELQVEAYSPMRAKTLLVTESAVGSGSSNWLEKKQENYPAHRHTLASIISEV